MNPTRWKWYTWVALLYFAGVFYANFNGSPAEGIISAIVGAIAWSILWFIHQVVRAVYLAITGKTVMRAVYFAITGKTPPPITKPPQGQG